MNSDLAFKLSYKILHIISNFKNRFYFSKILVNMHKENYQSNNDQNKHHEHAHVIFEKFASLVI